MISPFAGKAQDDDCAGAVMRLMGVTDLEDVDSYEVERLSEYYYDPINLNRSSVSELEKSGLLTYYQIVSLTDYRNRHGEVLSFTELSSVDGFSRAVVDVLSPFVSLEPRKAINDVGYKSINHELGVRAGGKYNDSGQYTYGLKYRLNSEMIQFGLSMSKAYDARVHSPSIYSGNISWKYGHGKLILGDFNARFGQGLCLWNSAVFSGLSLPSAYMRKPTGIAPANSFTGSSALTGLAADMCVAKWKMSAMLAMPGIKDLQNVSFMPAVNVARYGHCGMVSMTHMMMFTDIFSPFYRIPQMKTSVDASVCVRGVNWFGETAFDWVHQAVAAVCGTDFMASESLRMAVLLKYYPSDGFSNDYGMAVSGEVDHGCLHGNFSLEGSYLPDPKTMMADTCCQVKAQTEWRYMFSENFMMEFRFKERIRTWGPTFRTDVRIGAQYKSDIVTLSSRFNLLTCDRTGLLGYVEGGYTPADLSVFLRLGLFKVDDWDDRIYVYERDAPGNFNVPAYYGRGCWTSAFLSFRPKKWLKIYLRASYISYIFMAPETRKPGRAELKLQCVIRL